MSYIDQITVGSTTYDIQDSNAQRKAMTGSGAPTTSTAGAVGDYYIDTSATAAPYLYMCVDATGGTYTWERIDGKVNKNGDTMTGALRIKSSNIQDGMQSEAYGSGELAFHDVNGVRFGYFLPMAMAGSQGVQFSAVRTLLDENNEPYDVYHSLSLYIGSDGTRWVYFSDQSAWLHALGLVTSSTSTVSDIISVNTSNATVSSAQYVQNGRIAQVRITWTNRSAITVPASGNIANLSIGSIVSGKRPAIDYTGAFSNGDSGGPAWYTIAEGGAITLRACEGIGKERTIDSGTTFIVFATYILP